jgi:hypothetical protein
MNPMGEQRILLDGDSAMAFAAAFDKRSDYIRAELIHHLVDGEDRVPLPGCPECGTEAAEVTWSEHEEWMAVDVDPCRHRFRVEMPVMRTTVTEHGSVTVEPWRP